MRTLKHSNRALRGMTLVEVAISATILAMLFGLVALAVDRSNGVYRTSMTSAATESSVQRALETVAREFMDADRSSLVLTPAAPFAANSVEFRRSQGFDGAALIVGATRRIRFEYDPAESDDGIDNDSDGRIDEGRIVLNMDTSVVGGPDIVLVEDVSELLQGELPNGADDNGNGLVDEGGLAVFYDETTFTLTLRLTLQTLASDGTLVDRTAETAIRIRND